MKPKPLAPTARTVAAAALVRVWKDSAFAAAALDSELTRAAQLDGRDAALATELVLGTLRVVPWLEGRIDAHARRGTKTLDSLVRAHFVLAAYQLFFLERVPSFAAVSEAVGAIRGLRGREVAAFANAVLRKLAAEAEAQRPSFAEAVTASAPPWLRAALGEALTPEGAGAFLAAGAEPPWTGLRVENVADRDAWLARLKEAAPNGTFEASKLSPGAILARGAGRLPTLPGYADGAWTVQEEGSQLVGLAVGAQPGEHVLDACAGRGNKTAILARAVGSTGAVDAADQHPSKLDRLALELGRVGLAPRQTFAVDWSKGVGAALAGYDRVLVDAPCSGVGTLRRRPDLLLRRSPDNLAALAALQLAIVDRVAGLLRPGGRLVYAVCSVLREEAEGVVEALLAHRSDLEAVPFDAAPLRAIAGDATSLRLLPHVHGCDGYFLASFQKRSAGPT